MASAEQWIDGARLRTLALSVAPVMLGTAAAVTAGRFVWWKATLALVVAFFLQVGINYANDYSDGIRGTDDVRVGPPRLVGSGAAAPGTVRRVAFGCFGIACLAGVALALTSAWWLLLVGVACVLAAWFYTGGPHPYGYAGLGELAVFVFFGLVACVGTTFVQVGSVGWFSVAGGVAAGALATAVLVANNLRDIPTDAAVGKRTLSVRIGDRASRAVFIALVVLGFAMVGVLTAATPWALVGLAGLLLAVPAVQVVASGASGLALVPVLRLTGLAELTLALGVLVGVVIQAG